MKEKLNFGWKGVFKEYTYCDFLNDSIVPFFASLIILSSTYYTKIPSLDILSSVTDMSLSILPSILALLVTGYAILISFYWSDKAKDILQKDGASLLSSLNSSFAMLILTIIISLFYCIVVKTISIFQISFCFGDWVNISVIFIQLYLIFFIFGTLKDAVIDIYNIGNLSIKEIPSSPSQKKK